MNISYNWLKRYIALPDDAETVAKILTSIGLEVGTVETVETIRGGLRGLVVGEVLTCEAHPNSDHLHITKVNVGDVDAQGSTIDEQGRHILPIVCGAPNVAAGQKVIVATVGTVLYDGEDVWVSKQRVRQLRFQGLVFRLQFRNGLCDRHDFGPELRGGVPAAGRHRFYPEALSAARCHQGQDIAHDRARGGQADNHCDGEGCAYGTVYERVFLPLRKSVR